MIKRNNKKGFTIVELVIVIAVIAILAAVLIPTFAGIIKKANLSADMQAVRQMNTALAVDGAVTPTGIFALHEVLSEMGLTSEDYKPLTKDTYFFWDADKNRVLHVDENMTVITPEEYKGEVYTAGTSNWYSLTLEIEEKEVAISSGAVTVTSGAEMQYVLNTLSEGNKTIETINISGTIDMMGAAFDLPTLTNGMSLAINGSNSATIKNATAVDFAQGATADEDGKDGIYGCALIPKVESGASVTINGITIENMNVKNTNVSGAALLIGSLSGNADISGVTIKNSTVIGHRSVGALVGYISSSGIVNIGSGISLDNVTVQTVGGRSAMLVGLNVGSINFADGGSDEITMKNCSYGIYECEQNKGSFDGFTLGLRNGILYSSVTDGDGTKKLDPYCYVADALVLVKGGDDKINVDGADPIPEYVASDIFAGHVTGWNK